ncbi:MAG: hypothetical protein HQ517_02945 [SAR324 cluster bacterium]|nr:hypothetical protein [SAR324 cluster bacterium]
MNFKFLSALSDEDAAQFFQELLWKIGDAYDDGDLKPIVELAMSWQKNGYDKEKVKFEYDDGPFVKPAKKVSQSKLALITSTGHFVEGDDPEPFGIKDMTQAEAVSRIMDFIKEVPTLSRIPFNTPRDRLRVRHGGYDIRGVQKDPEVALPLSALSDMEKNGTIGELLPSAYSFVGACAQMRLIKETGPQWAAYFNEEKADVALLVPV